jgi:hypothetical protein
MTRLWDEGCFSFQRKYDDLLWSMDLQNGRSCETGSLGNLIIHDTGPAGYGFNVVQNNWNTSRLSLDLRENPKYQTMFEGWMTLPVAGNS